jgi:hypothetical protein
MIIIQQLGRLFIANLGHTITFNTTPAAEVQLPHVGRIEELCIFLSRRAGSEILIR